MAINPIGGMPPMGPGSLPPSVWPAFRALVAKFWRLLEAGELEAAETVLGEIFAMSRGLTALMVTYERCLAALETALAAAVETVEVVGGIVTLPESGIIICFAIIALYAIGGGSQPAYAEGAPGGGGTIIWRPTPVRRAEEFDRLEKMLFNKPFQAGSLISAPKSNHISLKAQAAAAGILLNVIKGFRSR